MTNRRTTQRSLSKEEEAELASSNKKVKDAYHASFSDRLNEGEVVGFKEKLSSAKLSFKEKLMGAIHGAFSQAFLFSDHMEAEFDFNDAISKLQEGIAAVKLSRTNKQRIRPWAKALIVKVYRRSVSYNFIQARLQSLWKLVGSLD